MTLVSIHQPNYLPWLGYIYKIYESDKFVFLDDVQYSNTGMHNYTYIKTGIGPQRMRIPVSYKFGSTINNVEIDHNKDWISKHLNTLEINYKNSKYYNEVMSDIYNIINYKTKYISDFNINAIKYFTNKLGINREYFLSSELKASGTKSDRVINLCKLLGASIYLSGLGAKAYQDENLFKVEKLELKYTKFHPVEYPQLHGSFQSNVFFIDYLMNCGYDIQNIINVIENE